MISSDFEGKLMGGVIEITLYDISPMLSKPIFDNVYKEGKRLEKIFNFFYENSELSVLNKKRKLIVSPELLFVLKKALLYCKKTSGAYDISIGKNILERKSGKALSKINCSYKDIKINGNEVLLLHPDVLIDLGSIAKGFIVDKLSGFLKELGVVSFFIDARGDMMVCGRYAQIVEIQDPRNKEVTFLPISLKNSAVATSGDYNQHYGGFDKSHILGQKDLISVTVVASNLTDADVFASCVFLLSPKDRNALLKISPKFKVLTIDKRLKKKAYNGFFDLVKKSHV
jgi:thiamine biosynthesis lipoprotein